MEKRSAQDLAFDPDYSEFNTIVKEIEELKEKMLKKETKGFFSSLLEKFSFKLLIQLD